MGIKNMHRVFCIFPAVCSFVYPIFITNGVTAMVKQASDGVSAFPRFKKSFRCRKEISAVCFVITGTNRFIPCFFTCQRIPVYLKVQKKSMSIVRIFMKLSHKNVTFRYFLGYQYYIKYVHIFNSHIDLINWREVDALNTNQRTVLCILSSKSTVWDNGDFLSVNNSTSC